jgi:DNA-binding transcriptional regulator LsrR (DeoR family)
MTFSADEFSQRLAAQLEAQAMSQSALAGKLGVSRSTVTGWLRHRKMPDAFLLHHICKTLNCSADWLLGFEAVTEKTDRSGLIHWTEQIPPYVQGMQREQIEYGIRLFNLIMYENRSANEIQDDYNIYTIRFALGAALRSGIIRLTKVERNNRLEQSIRTRFPNLKEVIVADVPLKYDDTVVRTELVTFLAATAALPMVMRPLGVGLGSGYTMLRFCEQSIPTIDQFSGTKWVPLLAFSPTNTSDYTANFLARLMSARHPGSQALYLPHPVECVSPEMKETSQHATRTTKNLQAIFMSVSGVNRRERWGKSHLLAEFRSADYNAEAASLREAYSQLPDHQRFGAELLRYLLDQEGRVIGSDSTVGNQIDLDTLRYHSEIMGRVWIIAASPYKAQAVLTCVRSGLANALVIDSEIAETLLGDE